MMIFIILLIGVLVLVTVVRLLMLRNDLGSFRQYWNVRASEPVPAGSITYIALGDSAAQGIGASKPQNGYVGLIESALEQKSGRPIHVKNLSVSGAKVLDVTVKQLPELKKLNVTDETIITLDIGGNDMRSYDATEFERQITELFSQLPKQTVVSDIPYFGGGRANKHERNASEASDIIRRIADQQQLRMAPLHEVTEKGDGWMIYAADFFHPNDRGYRNWFTAFWQVLDS